MESLQRHHYPAELDKTAKYDETERRMDQRVEVFRHTGSNDREAS